MSTLTHAADGWAPRSHSSLIHWITATDASATQALLRVTLALVLLPHGLQHLFGVLGGYGFAATVKWMSGTLGIPAPLAAAGILLEFIGPLLLLAGIGSRLVGLALAAFMTVAGSTHVANGFFMNWLGNLPAGVEGFEYHLLAVAIGIAIAVNGGGSYSVDRALDGATLLRRPANAGRENARFLPARRAAPAAGRP
jgi:putative oxidoreductase